MLRWLIPPDLRAVFLIIGYALSLTIAGVFVYPLGILKYLIPIKPWQRLLSDCLNTMPVFWTDMNTFVTRLFTRLDIEVIGAENLKKDDWYLMTANHCSWTDVLLLYRVFNHRLPVLKFFIKSQLVWMPVLGLGCKFIGYPFMKRYTKDQIAKKPELKGKDLETTKKMCEQFKSRPMTIVSFAEGTRYTKQKAKRQKTPYQHLLKPRAGGLAYTLMAMGDYLHQFVDVTICYDDPDMTFWDYISGRLKKVTIKVEVQPITQAMLGDYENDREYRVQFQAWLNQLWEKKDKTIEELRQR